MHASLPKGGFTQTPTNPPLPPAYASGVLFLSPQNMHWIVIASSMQEMYVRYQYFLSMWNKFRPATAVLATTSSQMCEGMHIYICSSNNKLISTVVIIIANQQISNKSWSNMCLIAVMFGISSLSQWLQMCYSELEIISVMLIVVRENFNESILSHSLYAILFQCKDETDILQV